MVLKVINYIHKKQQKSETKEDDRKKNAVLLFIFVCFALTPVNCVLFVLTLMKMYTKK